MDLPETFAWKVGRLARLWRKRLDERLRATGLTQARWLTLYQISRFGTPITQRELAELVGIEGSTLVRLLDALEKQGLVERHPVADDRRAKHIQLTPEAAPMLEEIDRIADELRHELLDDVDPDELEVCVRVLGRVVERIDQTNGEAHP